MVIPALNEAGTISAIVADVGTIAERVYVVDDGSTDDTGANAVSAGATIIRHDAPSGYDAAVAAGINRAFADGARAVVTCDADGQHRADDVRRVSALVLDDGFDFATGLRDRYNRRVEALIGLVSRFFFATRDPFCGLKCYARTIYDRVGTFPQDMHIGTLPLIWVRKYRFRSSFIEISVDARQDHPRFGRRIRADVKLLRAFGATLASMF